MQTIREMYKKEGIESFFKGLMTSVLLVVNPIIQFYFYEKLKRMGRFKKNQFLLNFLSGAVSKAIATLITFPYQVIRTYLQANKTTSLNSFHVIQQIFKSHGFMGFFTGLKYKLIQTVLNAALMLAIYEKIYLAFSNRFHKYYPIPS